MIKCDDPGIQAMSAVMGTMSRDDLELWAVSCWSSLSVILSGMSQKEGGFAVIDNHLPDEIAAKAQNIAFVVAQKWQAKMAELN